MSGLKTQQDFTLTFETQSIWGTAEDALPIGIPTEDMTIEHEPQEHVFNRAWGVRGQHEANVFQSTSSVIPTATCNMILTPYLLTGLLPGILQSDTSWTPSASVYSIYAHSGSVNYPKPKLDSSGSFVTLTRNSPDSGEDERIDSAIPTSLKLTISPTDNDGVLMGEFSWIGKGYKRGFTAVGTITNAEITHKFKFDKIEVASFGSHTFTTDLVSLELNITQGAKFTSDLPTGEVVFPNCEVNGTMKVIANAETEAMKDKADDNDVNKGEELKIGFNTSSTPAVNGELIITSHAYLTNYSPDYSEGEVIDFTFKGVFGAVAGEVPIKFEFYHA